MDQLRFLQHGTDTFRLAGEAVPRICVQQIASATNGAYRKKREATLAGLRLGKLNRVSLLPDSPETWGMIRAVEHLVNVRFRDHGPLPVSEPRKRRASRVKAVERKRRRRQKLARTAADNQAISYPRRSAPIAKGVTQPTAKFQRTATEAPRTAVGDALDAARRELGKRSPAKWAIADAGRALRRSEPTRASGRGDAAAQERLSRIDLEHDLLDLLLSDDRDIAWDAAREIARSFDGVGERIRLSRGDPTDDHVLEAVVEVLKGEGQRYFSLMRYERELDDSGGMLLRGNFVISRALDFPRARKAILPKTSNSAEKLQLLVYADGGIKAEDVTRDGDLHDEDVLLANSFRLAIPEKLLRDPVNISFVVPGVLVDTVEISSQAASG